MKKILILSVLAMSISACSTSKDEDVARCDTIANKYVEYFAKADEAGPVRSNFLLECVQGPDDESDSEREAWLTCAEEARTGGDLAKCKKVYDHDVKEAALEQLGKLSKEVYVELVCKGKTEEDEDTKKLMEKMEKLEEKARDAGVDSDEMKKATDMMGDKPYDEAKAELCKGITPPAAVEPAE